MYRLFSVSMSTEHIQASGCPECDRDFTVTSSNNAELVTCDQLLSELLSVKGFVKCSLFPHVFDACMNQLLDKLCASGWEIPYVAPSTDLIQAVRKFVHLMVVNKCLFDGIVCSTRAALDDLSASCCNRLLCVCVTLRSQESKRVFLVPHCWCALLVNTVGSSDHAHASITLLSRPAPTSQPIRTKASHAPTHVTNQVIAWSG